MSSSAVSAASSAASSLRVIVGPTAAGKSAVAMALAESNGGAIVSADSRQVYRGFDIGTAKPGAADRARVKHFGVDVADPTEQWSAARFASAASGWIDDARTGAHTPVLVGGTGLWVSALVSPLAPVPDLDPLRRAALHAEFAARTDAELREWCAQLDPAIARLGPAQWRRAIEVALLTGRRLSEWHADTPGSTACGVRYLLVDPGDALEKRIAARIDDMLAAGWMDEVRDLARAVPLTAIAWKACGYERLRVALDSRAASASVRDDVVRETRQYARRQRTWFRRQLRHGPVTMLDPAAPGALDVSRAWWDGARDS